MSEAFEAGYMAGQRDALREARVKTAGLTVEQAQQLVDEMISLDPLVNYDEIRVREDYSGRGMFGDRVVAIVVPDMSYMAAMGYAAAQLGIPYGDLPQRTDNLGYDTVVY